MNETSGNVFSCSVSTEKKISWGKYYYKKFKSFKLIVIIYESNLASSSDMLCILVSSCVLNEEAPLQDPASSLYTIMLQSWILISIGLSTVTSFKFSWQNYMKGCRIPIFTMNVPLPSHGIANYILLVFFSWWTTSKQSMHKVFPFHSLTSWKLHTDIWCYYQINISE